MSKPRARDLGIPFEGTPATYNAITDVPGVTVGYATVIEGESARTGVTIIHPRGKGNHEPVFSGTFAFNGNGEMTGAAWIDEGGMLEGPIGITNTPSALSSSNARSASACDIVSARITLDACRAVTTSCDNVL